MGNTRGGKAQKVLRWESYERETDGDWRDRAACAEIDPELWHPDKSESSVSRKAVAICRNSCPVRLECLTYALTVKDQGAIYGGLTARRRRPFANMVNLGITPKDAAIAALHGEQVLKQCAG